MKMAKGLTILCRSGAMASMDPNVATKLADAALDKGYDVRMFFYGEGVTCIKEGQGPKRFPNTGEELKKLIAKGLVISSCETCAGARGLHRGEEIENAKIGSLTSDLATFVSESERMITVGR